MPEFKIKNEHNHRLYNSTRRKGNLVGYVFLALPTAVRSWLTASCRIQTTIGRQGSSLGARARRPQRLGYRHAQLCQFRMNLFSHQGWIQYGVRKGALPSWSRQHRLTTWKGVRWSSGRGYQRACQPGSCKAPPPHHLTSFFTVADSHQLAFTTQLSYCPWASASCR